MARVTRARGWPWSPAHNGVLYRPQYRTPQHASASLKGPRKFSIQFVELHVDLSIMDNTELRRTCARARARVGVLYCPQYSSRHAVLKTVLKISVAP